MERADTNKETNKWRSCNSLASVGIDRRDIAVSITRTAFDTVQPDWRARLELARHRAKRRRSICRCFAGRPLHARKLGADSALGERGEAEGQADQRQVRISGDQRHVSQCLSFAPGLDADRRLFRVVSLCGAGHHRPLQMGVGTVK